MQQRSNNTNNNDNKSPLFLQNQHINYPEKKRMDTKNNYHNKTETTTKRNTLNPQHQKIQKAREKKKNIRFLTLTSSGDPETELENNPANITTKASLIRAIDSDDAGVARLHPSPYLHQILAGDSHHRQILIRRSQPHQLLQQQPPPRRKTRPEYSRRRSLPLSLPRSIAASPSPARLEAAPSSQLFVYSSSQG